MEMATKDTVKAVRIGDKLILFINGKRTTVSRKVAPEAFDKAVELIKAKDEQKLASMFSGVNEKITEYAKGIFEIKGNNVYALGEGTPAPKLVARKMFEMMNTNQSPKPLSYLNKKMQRNGKGVASGMEVFAKLDDIPMTTRGNLVLKVSITQEQLDNALQKGCVVGTPRGANATGTQSNYDLPVQRYESDDELLTVHCLVDPSDIQAFYLDTIRVGRFKILKNFTYEKSPIIEVPLEELYDIAFDIWSEHTNKKI